ncbi:transcription initiation factor tfiid [Anaeramoeba flamelloides]|uniref:Transcription initiation factor TFIID subunit 2 n=1 Tax=Anaeramoeba flamelloides TaxID=1746091 RepID=A0ABQ8XWW2_9EUKA|nr:transcription initiation factor tfiid [Anaeramoeba flamelloides]
MDVYHQKLTLSIDFENECIGGVSELFLKIDDKKKIPKSIHLHVQQYTIKDVFLNKKEVKYQVKNNFNKPIVPESTGCSFSLVEFQSTYSRKMQKIERGQLKIFLNQRKDLSKSDNFHISIHYVLKKPKVAIHFVKKPTRYVYTDPRNYQPYYWFPCFHSLRFHHTFELYFDVPEKYYVISNGQLSENFKKNKRSIFHYNLNEPITPSNIGFVCGTFSDVQIVIKHNLNLDDEENQNMNLEEVEEEEEEDDDDDEEEDDDDDEEEEEDDDEEDDVDEEDDEDEEDEDEEDDDEDDEDDDEYDNGDEDVEGRFPEDNNELLCTAFSLIYEKKNTNEKGKNSSNINNLIHKMRTTLQTLPASVKYCEKFLGFRFPYEFFNLVFLPNLPENVILSFASFTILSEKILYTDSSIDDIHFKQLNIILALTTQFFGQFLHIKNPCDHWIILGIAGHLSYLTLRCLFGNSEFLYQKIKNNEFLIKDKNFAEILYNYHPLTRGPINTKHYRIKSILVIQMLESIVGQEMYRNILNRLLFDATKKDSKKIVETMQIISIWRKATGMNFEDFRHQWLYTSLIPKLVCSAQFVKKKNEQVIELKVEQYQKQPFQGLLKVRVHEYNGIFDYYKKIESKDHNFNVFVVSRLHKHKKKQIEYENGEILIFQLGKNNPSPVFYIRIDPELNWIRELILLKNNDSMWRHELELERSVISQYETIKRLSHWKHEDSLEILHATLLDIRYFCPIRVEAAKAIAKQNCEESGWKAGEVLIEIFKKYYFDIETGIIKPNDFSDLDNYYLQKGIIIAISRVKDKNSNTPKMVVDFLLNLSKYNDNSENEYNDEHYCCLIIQAFGYLFPEDEDDYNKLFEEIERYLERDKLFPSEDNILTRTSLQTIAKFQNRVELDFELFKGYMTDVNYSDGIRIEAIYHGLFIATKEEFPNRFLLILEYITSNEFIEEFSPFYYVLLIKKIAKKLRLNKKTKTKTILYFNYVNLLKTSTITNEQIMKIIWNLMNRGSINIDLRNILFKLYDIIFGIHIPNPFKLGKSKREFKTLESYHKNKYDSFQQQKSFFHLEILASKKLKKKYLKKSDSIDFEKNNINNDLLISNPIKVEKPESVNNHLSVGSTIYDDEDEDEFHGNISPLPITQNIEQENKIAINNNNSLFPSIVEERKEINYTEKLKQNPFQFIPPIHPLSFDLQVMNELQEKDDNKNIQNGFFIRKIRNKTYKFIQPSKKELKFFQGTDEFKFILKRI